MIKAASRLIDLIPKDDPIVKYEGAGAQFLRQISKPILQFPEDLPELIERMEQIMRDANGVGLAAPQIGILQRIFVFDAGDGFQALVNPKILQTRGQQLGVEGCLSIPGLQGDVLRADEVVVKAYDQFGRPVRLRGRELTARVIQHELDHLDGILFIDRVEPDTLRYTSDDDDDSDADDDDDEAMV